MPIQVKIFSKTKDMYRERSYATARCQYQIYNNNNNNNIMKTLLIFFRYTYNCKSHFCR